MFQKKVDADGRNYKYNSSMVEKGFSQVQGVDYHDTFAPVAKMDSIRLVFGYFRIQALGGASHGC